MFYFPAVIIGGPPNSGKSILTANLTKALRQYNCPHYVLRANPDGEGDWTHMADSKLVETLLTPHAWTSEFVTSIYRDVKERQLPLLVDVGGRPQSWQESIFDACTHAILLTPDENAARTWHNLATRHHLAVIADIRSDLHGVTQLKQREPVIRGILANLRRGAEIQGPLFSQLVNRLRSLFAYNVDELRQLHLRSVPTELVIDLRRLARTFEVSSSGQEPHWKSHHLSTILNYLPASTPLGLYGRGPNWIYAAISLLTLPEPFYQFDPRRGWVEATTLGTGNVPDQLLQVQQQLFKDGVHLKFSIPQTYLDYDYLSQLRAPELTQDHGVILSGKLPHWLYTSLARTYQAHPWIAVYQPQLMCAVVIHSTTPHYTIGDCLQGNL